MRFQSRSVLTAGIIASLAKACLADQIIAQGMSPLQVTIRDFKDAQVIYTTPRGDENHRPYERIQQISVEGESALNAAEASFAGDNKDASIDNYVKAIRGTTKPWIKLFAARRLNDALGNQSRFDARLAAYLGVLSVDRDAAAKQKPQLPEAGSRYLDTAVTDVETTLKDPGLADAQKIGLLNFLIDIHRRRGDEPAATAALERVAKISGGTSTDPAIIAQLTMLKVAQAQLAIDQKNYPQAVKLINDVRPTLTDPKTQSDALMVLARASLATADKTDKAALQDAALAFMRVVANFGDSDGRYNVLPALQQTAEILEQTGDTQGAITLLGQVAKEFDNTPAAAKAQQDIQRLKKG